MLFCPGLIMNGPVSNCSRVAPAGTEFEMISVAGVTAGAVDDAVGVALPFDPPPPPQAASASVRTASAANVRLGVNRRIQAG